MSLRNRLQDAKTLFRLGMLCLLAGILASWFLHPAPGFSQDAIDGARGVLYGLSIGLCLWSVRLAGRPGRGHGAGG